MKTTFAVLALLVLTACSPEPRFKSGDVVQFKGLGTRALVIGPECALYRQCRYVVRMGSGAWERVAEIELEPAQ